MKKIIAYCLFPCLLLFLFARCDNDEIKLYDSFFNVSVDSLIFVFDADSAKLPVATNTTDWDASVTGDASWLTIKKVTDMPRNFVVVYPEDNLLEEPRFATVILTGNGLSYTVILKQNKFVPPPPPGHKILTNENAGELNSLLVMNEKETITNLKLSGVINYADLIVMREMILEMELRHIDLENASIVASESYAANTIPPHTYSACNNLLSIVLPNTLVMIGADGFSNSNGLTSIVLPNSLTELGQGVFYNSTNLEEVIMSSSLAKAGHYQFGNSKLKRLDIPAPLAAFDHLYWGLSKLEEVNVHEDHPDFA